MGKNTGIKRLAETKKEAPEGSLFVYQSIKQLVENVTQRQLHGVS